MMHLNSVRSMVATLFYLVGGLDAPKEGRSEWQTIYDDGE